MYVPEQLWSPYIVVSLCDRASVHVSICMYIYMYICMCICVYMYVYIYMYIYICASTIVEPTHGCVVV